LTNNAQNYYVKGKGKAVPLQARRGPEGSRKLRFPGFVTSQDSSRLSALHTDYVKGNMVN